MQKKWIHLVIIVALFCTLFSPFTHQEIHTYAQSNDLKVSGEILHLREGPGLSYPILTTLEEGEGLTSIEKNGDWIHVKTGNYEGWVAAWLTTAIEAEKEIANQTVISQVDHLNIRADSNLSAVVLGQLSTGEKASFIQENAEWVQIAKGNITGWVSKGYVTINTEELPQTEVTIKNEEIKPESNLEEGTQYFTVKVNAVNIRKKASLNSKKIGIVKKDKAYKVLDRQHNWIQIQYSKKQTGWVYSFYGSITAGQAFVKEDKNSDSTMKSVKSSQSITIIYNGTNLREEPSTNANVVERVDAGESFEIIESSKDWYKIKVNDKKTAYVASWVVTLKDNLGTSVESNNSSQNEQRKKGTLKGVTIVVDAGHGGNDHGTTGARGTDEKDITLQTATLLASKLSAVGATVVMTRESDEYVDLRKRVSVAHQHNADAFLSLHYDATDDSSISGFTTYYMNSNQKKLAEYVHDGLGKKIDLRDRGSQKGNYLVLRENRQPSILIELGFLSNPSEERSVDTAQFREQATLGIYNGVLNYFDALIE